MKQPHLFQASEALAQLANVPLIGRNQSLCLREMFRSEERQYFFDIVCELWETAQAVPKLNGQEDAGEAARLYLHYFTSGGDWYVTERNGAEAFGMADLGNGLELGYLSLREILDCGAELDFHWAPKTIGELKRKQEARAA